MEAEIQAEFNKSGFSLEDDEILKKCLTFCLNYNLTPSDLVSSWEVYYLNRQLNEPTVQNSEMEGFLLYLQNEQRDAVIKEEPGLHIYSIHDVDMILNEEDKTVNEDIPGTPTENYLRPHSEQSDSIQRTNRSGYSSAKPSKLVTPFGQRTNKFVVKFSINNLPNSENYNSEHESEDVEDGVIKRIQPRKKCSLIVHGNAPEPGCRFMYDRIEDRFNALENRLEKHAIAIASSGLYEELMDPTIASQRNLFAVGMICCDGGLLNEKSVLLQSSVKHSGGQRVRLDLHKLSHFSIFPGQILGIDGHNPSGHCLIASKLVDCIPLSITTDVNLHPAKKQALDQDAQSTDLSCKQPEISVIIASGPFTTVDNLYFEPLTELLAYASRKLPQLLILLGPFVDSEHPEIKKGTTDRTFDEIFQLEILRRLQDHVEYMGSDIHVILVPSTRDAHHDFVFPQPAFDIHPPDLKHQLTCLTNPSKFEANQVKVACCTTDILKHLSGEEMSRTTSDGAPSDRMSRLASHILSQCSFYPLYPPAEEVPMDFSLAPEALNIGSVPDILILPSDMKFFLKVLSLGQTSEVEGQMKCLCVNPGRLAKGEGGGTFVELNYHGSPDMMNASIISI
ncbi:putative alpha DNA polymerase [Tripterygium wilfordii]|uniref:DNA polymerase alpha subunit B n=1 Tax=Tripterygium wilfordii TaxID=458696 RepID=A0A7J7DJG0_TRIWF|nr:DNA polymerase alpha subunit B [Tripterygium wilfordii]KAF5746492.1 putative alpha DNA polymerase [Tripterygium wilfordii]